MNIAIIGGGAGGMLASIVAARSGAKVSLFEKNPKLGKKIYITGKGRCNLTNLCTPDEFLKNVNSNSKFLYSAIYKFTPQNTVEFFNALGLETVVERGDRVFPESQKASDVTKALSREMERLKVQVNLECEVLSIRPKNNAVLNKGDEKHTKITLPKENFEIMNCERINGTQKENDFDNINGECFSDCQKEMKCGSVNGENNNCEIISENNSNNGYIVATSFGEYEFDKIIVATGGVSYPSTGSTGDGIRFAKKLGLKIVELRQGLVQLLTVEDVSPLEGLSLKNVELKAFSQGKTVSKEFGEMLFTKRGLSGPISLTVSSLVNRLSNVELYLDLKPAISFETLDNRLLREFSDGKNAKLKNIMLNLAPSRLCEYLLNSASIDGEKTVSSITKEERMRLANAFKGLKFTLKKLGGFEEAVITCGGVSTQELKPTMECKKYKGLYFVGETVDVDAMTGGFNLQIAFSTAYIAATDATKQ